MGRDGGVFRVTDGLQGLAEISEEEPARNAGDKASENQRGHDRAADFRE